ncbi:AlpA family phage regulatory protein [Acuticoccus sp. MNP-M23]|uniref:helix-turn-helix transcriptional regulator n=1 Tax=Acuticoccus sp. MNP-M23 TaxID=3072793 RepID=UPI002814B6CA|nr:AlpA family phage regulatory protein [Acuticoccus sp. MNP-M23]WMS43121.1 AlpA family phage regulatory protein [Acuticoccus sp. MNP-M23]
MDHHSETLRPIVVPLKEAHKMIGVGRSTFYELLKEPKFPRPVEIVPGRKSFVVSEIEQWVAQRVARRNAEVA